MGWSFTYGATRADIIAKQIETWSSSAETDRVIAHTCVGNVLWTVHEQVKNATPDQVHRYIGCDLLQRENGYGWGYKDMCESVHPYYYTCPLKYLDIVPVACEKWREKVREHHAGKRKERQTVQEAQPGDMVVLKENYYPRWGDVTEVRTAKNGRKTVIAYCFGRLYRVPAKGIESIIRGAEERAAALAQLNAAMA